MRTRSLVAALVPFVFPVAPAVGAEDIQLDFKGRSYALDEVPGGLPEQHAADIEEWTEWAVAHDYHLTLDASKRVLLVAGHPGKRLKKELKLVEQVLERADGLFPMPANATQESAAGTTSGVTTNAQRAHLAVLLLIDGDKDYASVLERLSARHAYLRAWSAGASSLAGFVLTRPLCGAWLTRGADLEEWSPQNELVNRLTRVLLLQRFGRLPEWLSQGLAWELEVELLKGIYCFPRRHQFVFASEHGGWDDRLASEFKRRADDPLKMRELCALTRERFDGAAALVAFGGASYLVTHHPESLVPLFEGLAADREAHGRRDLGGGRWEILPEYDAPPDVQSELMRAHVGDDVFQHMTTFFRLGKRYRE